MTTTPTDRTRIEPPPWFGGTCIDRPRIGPCATGDAIRRCTPALVGVGTEGRDGMRRLALAASLLVVAACAAPMPSPSVTPIAEPAPPARTAAPTEMSSPSLPSATANRPAHAGAHPIADPYWLLYSGTSTSTFTDT